MRRRRPTAAICHPRLGLGGAEQTVMWCVEALKLDFDVSLFTAKRVDLPRLNEVFGTNVRKDEVRIRVFPSGPVFSHVNRPGAVRSALFLRASREAALDYDVVLAGHSYCLCDFDVPAIHLIEDFSWDLNFHYSIHSTMRPPTALRRAYYALARGMAGSSGCNLLSDSTLLIANSHWTAQCLMNRYGASARIIYPPVAGAFKAALFEPRSSDFVCIGRMAPQKRLERIVTIISRVRRRGHHVGLRIIAPLDRSSYGQRIQLLARDNSDWITLEGELVGEGKENLLAGCRYGIHACEGETFGIGVAEMVKAGCITFVPAEGGQAEIIDHEALLYRDDDDAVEKIIGVLNNHSLREDLIQHLRCQGEKFSAENFMAGLRHTVEHFIEVRDGADAPTKPMSRSGMAAS